MGQKYQRWVNHWHWKVDSVNVVVVIVLVGGVVVVVVVLVDGVVVVDGFVVVVLVVVVGVVVVVDCLSPFKKKYPPANMDIRQHEHIIIPITITNLFILYSINIYFIHFQNILHSLSALSDESLPCAAFFLLDSPKSDLMVYALASFGSVAPMNSLHSFQHSLSLFATFVILSSIMTTGPVQTLSHSS